MSLGHLFRLRVFLNTESTNKKMNKSKYLIKFFAEYARSPMSLWEATVKPHSMAKACVLQKNSLQHQNRSDTRHQTPKLFKYFIVSSSSFYLYLML